jgi:hypothetical protein
VSAPESGAYVPRIGERVLTPIGRIGTVVGVKTVWVQLDDVASRNYCDVRMLEPAPPQSGDSLPDGAA